MELLLSICIGLGLSAACGFRVFLPMLLMGLAGWTDHLVLSGSWSWIATPPAMMAFGVATALEIGAYYVPWIDNMLDTVATPVSFVAGVVAMSSVVAETSPLLHWSIAVVGGGGSAAVVHAGTVVTRQVSALTTGGLGNPIVSTMELGGAVLMSVLAVVLPLLAVALLIGCGVVAVRSVLRLRALRQTKLQQAT